ncbi:hypothetical protein Taro_038054 [Colocasia esculenta]|uniref:Uncharacterized protein n=1 Tax=Colocasia esculenta TaxID=4460 RepID=A0A843WBN1_COLES|nr:hypothetical protein [Colocasia esculenta]
MSPNMRTLTVELTIARGASPSGSVSVECVNVCKLSNGDGAGGRYECSVLSCAWKAPRVLTGSLASTTQPHCPSRDGRVGGRNLLGRANPRRNQGGDSLWRGGKAPDHLDWLWVSRVCSKSCHGREGPLEQPNVAAEAAVGGCRSCRGCLLDGTPLELLVAGVRWRRRTMETSRCR